MLIIEKEEAREVSGAKCCCPSSIIDENDKYIQLWDGRSKKFNVIVTLVKKYNFTVIADTHLTQCSAGDKVSYCYYC